MTGETRLGKDGLDVALEVHSPTRGWGQFTEIELERLVGSPGQTEPEQSPTAQSEANTLHEETRLVRHPLRRPGQRRSPKRVHPGRSKTQQVRWAFVQRFMLVLARDARKDFL